MKGFHPLFHSTTFILTFHWKHRNEESQINEQWSNNTCCTHQTPKKKEKIETKIISQNNQEHVYTMNSPLHYPCWPYLMAPIQFIIPSCIITNNSCHIYHFFTSKLIPIFTQSPLFYDTAISCNFPGIIQNLEVGDQFFYNSFTKYKRISMKFKFQDESQTKEHDLLV